MSKAISNKEILEFDFIKFIKLKLF